jgi:phosphoglycerate dehydrogenase-like enzyme
MCESILFTAQAQAQSQGVTADGMVGHGDIGEKTVDACHELGLDCLVLGRPQPREAENVFTQAQLQASIARREEQTEAKVVLPEQEAA